MRTGLFFVLQNEDLNDDEDKSSLALPSTKDTNDTTDLVVTSNDGIDLAFLGKGSEVDSILAECIKALLRGTTLDSPIAANLFDRRDKCCLCEAGLLQHRGQ